MSSFTESFRFISFALGVHERLMIGGGESTCFGRLTEVSRGCSQVTHKRV